jgi:large subunit ribosomal protein L4
MPKKERRMAIFSLLSDKVKNNALFVLNADGLEPKTKNVREALLALGLKAKVLFALVGEEGQIAKAAHSIPLLKAVLWQNINVKDLLDCDYLVLSFKALNRIKEVWGQ